jgi:PKD repeat protein
MVRESRSLGGFAAVLLVFCILLFINVGVSKAYPENEFPLMETSSISTSTDDSNLSETPSPSPDTSTSDTETDTGTTTSTASQDISQTPSPTASTTTTKTATVTETTSKDVADSSETTTTTGTAIPTETPTPPPPPIADFDVVHKGNGEFEITFKGDGTIDGFLFDMGDEQGVSQETEFTYTYAEPGTYTIVLTVWGAGEYTSIGQTITVEFPLVAKFDMSYTGSQAPLEVTFINQSVGQVTDVFWDFGDGSTSTDYSPTHTFSIEGDYLVKLTIIGPHGKSSYSALLTIGTNQSQTLEPSFVANPTTCIAPCDVVFTDTSTGPIVSHEWDFGNGESSQQEVVTVTYQDAGTYDVILTISDGKTSVPVEGQVIVSSAPQAPVSTFIVTPDSGPAPLTVQFQDQSTGIISQWNWAFGDGNTSTARNPEHTYSQEGAYIVVLTVTGPDGVGQSQHTIYVSRQPSEVQASFTPISQAPANPMTYVFDSGNSVGNIASYSWNFGDGNTSTEANPQHTYSQEGTYSVTLELEGTDGSQSSATVQVSAIQFDLPTADFNPSPGGGDAPLEVHFSDTSMPGSVPIISWYWEFGDGDTSTEQNPVHTYSLPGDYPVTLTIRDENDYVTTHIDTIYVREATVHARIGCSTNAAFVGETINFADRSWGLPGVAWDWDFADGNYSTLQNPDYAYSVPGTYDVVFTAEDENGYQSTDSCTITIIALDDVLARFSVSDSQGPIPHKVSFTENSLGDIISYDWTFGDGRSSNLQVPDAITYSTVGSYEINLTVVGASGKTSTATKIVSALEPLAITVDAQPTLGVAPMRVNLSGSANGSVWSWRWDLGNGVIRWGKNISYVFMSPGNYEIEVLAKGPAGQTTETLMVRVVEAGNIQAALRANVYGGLAPLQVCFASLSSGEITNYSWDFGDGATAIGKDVCHTYSGDGDYRVVHAVSGPGGTGEAITTIRVFDASLDLINLSYAANGGSAACFFVDDSGFSDFQWFFGDGQTSSQESPCHKYTGTGDFVVYMVAKDATGQPVIGISPITVLESGEIIDTPVIETTPPTNATPSPDDEDEENVDGKPALQYTPYQSDSDLVLAPPDIEHIEPSDFPTEPEAYFNETLQPLGEETVTITPNVQDIPIPSWEQPPSIPLSYCGMTLHGQDTAYSCLAASLCTVLSASHNTTDSCVTEMRSIMEETGVMDLRGAALETAPLFLNTFGRLDSRVVYELTYENIVDYHIKGYQIVLPLEIIDGSVFHSVVIVDVTETEITYADPSLGSIRSIPREDFELWNGTALLVPGAEYCLSPTPKKQGNIDPASALLLLSGAAIATLTAIAAGDEGRTTYVSGINGQITSSIIGVYLLKRPGLYHGTANRIRAYPDGTRYEAFKRCYKDGHWWAYQRISDGTYGWMAQDWSSINLSALPIDCPEYSTDPGTTPTPDPTPDPIMGSPLPIPDDTPLFGTLPLPITSECPKLTLAVKAANIAIEAANRAHHAYERTKWKAAQAWQNYNEAKRKRDSSWNRVQECTSRLTPIKSALALAKFSLSFAAKQLSRAEDWVRSGKWKSILTGNKWAEMIINWLPDWLFKITGDFISWFKQFSQKVWEFVPFFLRSKVNKALSWIKSKAQKAYDYYQDKAKNYESASKKVNYYREKTRLLVNCITNSTIQAGKWAAEAIRQRGIVLYNNGRSRMLKIARGAAIAARNAAVNLVYRYRGECEEKLAEQARFAELANSLEILTGIDAQDWLNASDQTLGRFDKAADMVKLQEWFTKLQDWGISKDFRHQIADRVVNGSWDEWHVWKLTDLTKQLDNKEYWLQYGVDNDIKALENEIAKQDEQKLLTSKDLTNWTIKTLKDNSRSLENAHKAFYKSLMKTFLMLYGPIVHRKLENMGFFDGLSRKLTQIALIALSFPASADEHRDKLKQSIKEHLRDNYDFSKITYVEVFVNLVIDVIVDSYNYVMNQTLIGDYDYKWMLREKYGVLSDWPCGWIQYLAYFFNSNHTNRLVRHDIPGNLIFGYLAKQVGFSLELAKKGGTLFQPGGTQEIIDDNAVTAGYTLREEAGIDVDAESLSAVITENMVNEDGYIPAVKNYSVGQLAEFEKNIDCSNPA